jgi:hypothetical protein
MKVECNTSTPVSPEIREAIEKHWAETGITDKKSLTEVDSTVIARTLDEFVKPTGNDPDELLKHRFLCIGGGLLLVGPTGHGKSSLAMQFMIKWALGQSALGIEPAGPLKSLLIQAENDDGDLAEMKTGVFNGLGLTPEQQAQASGMVFVRQEVGKTGAALCSEVIEPLLRTIRPKLLWLDPALAYIGCDMNSQKEVGAFLRNHLAPLLAKYQCAVIIVHHTNKLSNDPEKQLTDFTYMGAGSAEWANWSRAILGLNKLQVGNLYELVAAKRGSRLRWKTADGEGLTMKRYIAHSKRPDTICWVEMAFAEAEELKANNGKSGDDVMKHVPQHLLIGKSELIKLCGQNGIGKHLADGLIKELVEDELLYEVKVARTGTKPKVLISRQPVAVKSGVQLDAFVQNSQGHYSIPAEPVAQKSL